ncbi:Nif3-like dinuclear metal center hexameric protein [Blattabacterium cuenoti]|uniref:Nif3-like dinuclear metal center hexameric protein n=1 Tax=Blattabacterium cuenoti TaxID=1653831 RepID=UPI00163C747B|nr:Nif3-like dinuclear metal center hexameric protein [Blattabacterium cuenoti]
MKVLVKHVIDKLENLAPIEYSEPYDNVGLIVGNFYQEIENILVTLDLTEKVLLESISKKCNLIISFHPIIFYPIKKITGKNSSERIIIKALKNNISIYVIHTNLDSVWEGPTCYLSNLLGINREKVLIPKKGMIKKLNAYVPNKYVSKVRNALFKAGAGNISNYSKCSYNFDGIGSYMGNDNSNPFHGEKGIFHMEKETCICVVFPSHKLDFIKKALLDNHPYEEVAYEIYSIENYSSYLGIGFVGNLIKKMNIYDFISHVKQKMNLSCIRYSNIINKKKKINRVSMIPGSGSFGIKYAIQENSDIFISSDLKYHDFFKNEYNITIMDIGHYESEKFTKHLIKFFLENIFTSIFVYESETITNPIEYFY